MPIDVVKFTAMSLRPSGVGFMWLTPMATFSPCGGLRSRAPSADGDLHRGFERYEARPASCRSYRDGNNVSLKPGSVARTLCLFRRPKVFFQEFCPANFKELFKGH